MKRLILLRHAKTEPLTDAVSDFERKLKKRGIVDANLIAGDLKKRSYLPELIISSPAKRAIQTAGVCAAVFNIPESEIMEERFVYDGDTTARMVAAIAGLAGEYNTVMVVGHNPDVARRIMQLSGTDYFHFPTCAAAVISFAVADWDEVNVGGGKAEYFVYPKLVKDNL